MMLPADTQEMVCSVLRPPKTTATRVLRLLMGGTLPSRRMEYVDEHPEDVPQRLA